MSNSYKTQPIWILKSSIAYFFIFLMIMLYVGVRIGLSIGSDTGAPTLTQVLPYILGVGLFVVIIIPIYQSLVRANFSFSLDPQYITARQGIIAKQERHIFYGVIQNIYLNQDLFDRMLGLATIKVEDASQQGDAVYSSRGRTYANSGTLDLGFSGNRLNISGLKKEDAEKLRDEILDRIKQNPTAPNYRGI